jgi:hypothetical protein
MPADRSFIEALRNLLSEVDLPISTTVPLPENRTPRCRELLRAALALAGDLGSQTKMTPAAIMGRKGGTTTAKRGSEYFQQLAAERKTQAGGKTAQKAVVHR